MYSIMIVDDDPFFASIFTSNFDWEGNGFYVAAHAENCAKAIEYLHSGEPVDLAFIDMCMPGMNGPELIAYITESFPDICSIALSNHDDFDFVKESFRAGAVDYVLKHCLNRVEMQRIVGAFLKRRGDETDRVHTAPPASEETGADFAAHYLNSLLEGRFVQQPSDYRLSDALKLPRLERNLLVIRTQLSDYERFRMKYLKLSKLEYILRSICSILRNNLERHAAGVVFFGLADKCFYSILTDDRFSDLNFLSATKELYIRQVSTSLQMYFDIAAQSIAAPLVADVRDISRARGAFPRVARASDGDAAQEMQVDFEGLRAYADTVLSRSMDAPDFEDARRYIARCYEDGHRLGYTQNQFLQLSMALYKTYLDLSARAETDSPKARGRFLGLFEGRNVREMEDMVSSCFMECYLAHQAQSMADRSVYVRDAQRLIAQNYSLPSLSLNVVADMIHVSSSYLSRSFKSEVGIGISEYINRFRIERAQAMFLIDHPNVRAVSARCGFENYTYFFRVFKKYTGLTPKEFCEKYKLAMSDPPES